MFKFLATSTAVILSFGYAAGEYGPSPYKLESDGELISSVVERPKTTIELSGESHRSDEVNQAIKNKVDIAANHLETAIGQAPAVAAAMVRSINDHGPVRALLYTDPQVQRPIDSISAQIGMGLKSLADAVKLDLIDGAKGLRGQI